MQSSTAESLCHFMQKHSGLQPRSLPENCEPLFAVWRNQSDAAGLRQVDAVLQVNEDLVTSRSNSDKSTVGIKTNSLLKIDELADPELESGRFGIKSIM